MVYAVPEQRALAWGGGFGSCGFGLSGCYGGFFGDPFGFSIHKYIQTISQVNTCPGNGDDQKASSDDGQDQNQKDKQTICLNTAVNTDGRDSVTLGVGSFNPIESTDGHKQPSKEIAIKLADGHKQPSKEIAIGGNGGSGGGGTGGSGGGSN